MGKMRDDTRRYSIEIKDVATDGVVLFTLADWTVEDVRAAVTQLARLARRPEDTLTRDRDIAP